MWKSFLNCCNLTIFLISTLFFKKLVKLQHKIAWLTCTGIQFLNGPWFSGMLISSSRGLKNPQKLALGKKSCLPKTYGSWEGKIFPLVLIFEDFATLGMKKFPYLKPAHSEILYLSFTRFITLVKRPKIADFPSQFSTSVIIQIFQIKSVEKVTLGAHFLNLTIYIYSLPQNWATFSPLKKFSFEKSKLMQFLWSVLHVS